MARIFFPLFGDQLINCMCYGRGPYGLLYDTVLCLATKNPNALLWLVLQNSIKHTVIDTTLTEQIDMGLSQIYQL